MSILADEITNDPLTRGYSGMTDAQVAADINTVYRTQNKTSVSGADLMEQIDSTEYIALSDTKKNQWLSLCGIDTHDPFGNVVQVVVEIWGGGSTTVSNLSTFRVNNVSRGVELGIGEVSEGAVNKARAE